MQENYREIPSPLQVLGDVLDDYIATTPSFGRMLVRGFSFVVLTGLLVGPYVFAGLINRRLKRYIGSIWFRITACMCGLKIVVSGVPASASGIMFAANHVSYLDIIVLGACVDARFVAKSEVASWPVFGWLAKRADTVFVTRDRRFAKRDSSRLAALLAADERLIIFPEGTSSNGRSVLPFKTSLFAAADPKTAPTTLYVQPVSIAYTVYADGRPLKGQLCDLYAWYGDMTLFGHLLTVFGLRGARVEITFLAPLAVTAYPDRKALAQSVERHVRDGLNASLSDAPDQCSSARIF